MKKSPDQFWKSLLRTQFVLNLPSKDLVQMLGLTAAEFERAMLYRAEIPASGVMNYCSQLGLSFDALMAGQIDYKCLAQNYHQNANVLPEKYQTHANSKRRLVVGILNSIEKIFGWEKRAAVLRRFQVNEAMFADPSAPINLNLAVDIAGYFHRLGGDSRVLQKFGQDSVVSNRGGEIGQMMEVARNPQEALEFLVEAIIPQHMERNYNWHVISATKESIRVAGVPNEFLEGEMKAAPDSHRLVCQIRAGFIANAPSLSGFKGYKVRKLHCVADNHPWCEFELTPPELRRIASEPQLAAL